MNDMSIAVYTLLAVLIGSIVRVAKGVLDAKNAGEKFDWSKLLSTLIANVIESLIAFGAINAVEFGVDGVAFLMLIIGGFLMGYYGGKPIGKTAMGVLSKYGGNK